MLRGLSALARGKPIDGVERLHIALPCELAVNGLDLITSMGAACARPMGAAMTNPVFAGAGALDLEFEIAAQTFGASSFSVNGGSVDFGALVARHPPRTTRQDARTRNTGAFIVRFRC